MLYCSKFLKRLFYNINRSLYCLLAFASWKVKCKNNVIFFPIKTPIIFISALCKDDANGNVPLGKSCNRYWACQGGYPRLQRCPAMLVFDKNRKRCVTPPTEDCEVPTTSAPPPEDQFDNPSGSGPRSANPRRGGGSSNPRRGGNSGLRGGGQGQPISLDGPPLPDNLPFNIPAGASPLNQKWSFSPIMFLIGLFKLSCWFLFKLFFFSLSHTKNSLRVHAMKLILSCVPQMSYPSRYNCIQINTLWYCKTNFLYFCFKEDSYIDLYILYMCVNKEHLLVNDSVVLHKTLVIPQVAKKIKIKKGNKTDINKFG